MKEEFLRRLTDAVKARFGEAYDVFPVEIPKGNGVKATGILIKRCGDTAAPVIYIDGILQQIAAGNLTIQEGIGEVLKAPLESFVDAAAIKAAKSLSKQDILGRVVHGVINAKYNQSYLSDKVYHKFLDLAVIYRVVLEETVEGCRFMILTNDACSRYGINSTELEEAARRNTEHNGFRVEQITKVLADLMEVPCPEKCEQTKLWVCRMKGISSEVPYGAGVLLYEEVFKGLADKLGADLFILPSSTHEVLVTTTEFDSDDLHEIVKEINRSGTVETTDLLSDSIYYYSRVTRKITIVQGAE